MKRFIISLIDTVSVLLFFGAVFLATGIGYYYDYNENTFPKATTFAFITSFIFAVLTFGLLFIFLKIEENTKEIKERLDQILNHIKKDESND
jgi:glucan phosphoethanolaminetransferase (alkaline phosphatase superfamily)